MRVLRITLKKWINLFQVLCWAETAEKGQGNAKEAGRKGKDEVGDGMEADQGTRESVSAINQNFNFDVF